MPKKPDNPVIERRGFIVALASLLLSVVFGRSSDARANSQQPMMEFSDSAAAIRLGNSCLEVVGHRKILKWSRGLKRELCRQGIIPGDDAESARVALRSQCSEDYLANRVVNIRGLRLSKTEATLLADFTLIRG